MSVLPVHLAIEDQLSEAVLRTLLKYSGRDYAIGTAYRRNGYGYLKKTIRGWNSAARSRPFIVLTDLDDGECAPNLIRAWLGTERVHPNLIFRVAVREVESWLLGDRRHLAQYLGVAADRIPHQPDDLRDPKATLLNIAKLSRFSELRARLLPKIGSTAKQGPDYNGCLVEFVDRHWVIDEASANSPSLKRAIDRLAAFEPKWD
jgi:hypothetical protein